LYLGRYVEEKGIRELLEAFRLWTGTWKLIFCGHGPLAELIRSHARVDPRIEERGFVQPSNIPGLMGQASALIVPSKWEPWGAVVLEAAAAGLPALCTLECGVVDDLVEDGQTGMVIARCDPMDIRATLDRFVALSREERGAMGDAAKARAEGFSLDGWVATLSEWMIQGRSPDEG
jgi:glycosyltransferase involved in cell wall biosynthesis